MLNIIQIVNHHQNKQEDQPLENQEIQVILKVADRLHHSHVKVHYQIFLENPNLVLAQLLQILLDQQVGEKVLLVHFSDQLKMSLDPEVGQEVEVKAESENWMMILMIEEVFFLFSNQKHQKRKMVKQVMTNQTQTHLT